MESSIAKGLMNKGGITNKKTKVGSMDYRKGGLFK